MGLPFHISKQKPLRTFSGQGGEQDCLACFSSLIYSKPFRVPIVPGRLRSFSRIGGEFINPGMMLNLGLSLNVPGSYLPSQLRYLLPVHSPCWILVYIYINCTLLTHSQLTPTLASFVLRPPLPPLPIFGCPIALDVVSSWH